MLTLASGVASTKKSRKIRLLQRLPAGLSVLALVEEGEGL